ncbi:hypothetical protein [Sphingomonas aurantiaca]|uniref:hypothetical protein n=1 Tax=Sphingomonas aurantiaca TaxID=185949 RepID=UPI00125FA120|nr:hypothetical protein [Sphingomonas aurantiaca]
MLAQLMRQGAERGVDLVTLRAIAEEAGELGAARALARVEAGLLRAVRSGKLGFEELKGVALSALDAIAAAALKAGVQSVLSGGCMLAGGVRRGCWRSRGGRWRGR